MATHSKINALHERLVAERERIVMIMADLDSLPAAGAVAQLANLDAAIVAVEAVIEDQGAKVGATRGMASRSAR